MINFFDCVDPINQINKLLFFRAQTILSLLMSLGSIIAGDIIDYFNYRTLELVYFIVNASEFEILLSIIITT